MNTSFVGFNKVERNFPKSKFNLIRPMLIGYVHITTIDLENNFAFSSMRCIGLLVDSYIVLVHKGSLKADIIKSGSTRMKFFSSFFTDDHSECNYLNRTNNCIRMRSDNTIATLESTDWIMMCLSNPFGDFILHMNQIEENYFQIESYKDKDILYLILNKRPAIKFEEKSTSGLLPETLIGDQVKTLPIGHHYKIDDRIYVLLETNKFESYDTEGFLVTEDLKVIGLYKGKILDFNEIFKRYNKILQNFEDYKKLESVTLEKKSHYYKFLLVELFPKTETDDFYTTLNYVKNTYYCDVGLLNFSSKVYHSFLEQTSDKTASTICIIGENLIKRMNPIVKIKDIDMDLILRKVITKSSRNFDEYAMKKLSFIGFNFSTNYFKSVMNSFYFYNSIIELNLSSNPLDFIKCEHIAYFLYNSPWVININLSNTNMPLNGLYLIINAILQNKAKEFDCLDISNNKLALSSDEELFDDKDTNNMQTYYKFPMDLNVISDVLSSGKFKSLNFKHLKNISKVKHQDWDSNRIISKLFLNVKQLASSDNLCYLNLSYWDMGHNEVMICFTKLLNLLSNLNKLILSNCEINDKGFGTLVDSLAKRQALLEILDISSNRITHSSVKKMQNLFQFYSDESKIKTKDIEHSLFLNDNRTLSDQDALIYIGINFSSIPINLDLSNVGLNLDALTAIANILKRGVSIVKLNLSKNNINDDMLELSDLGNALDNNSWITMLHLYNNSISFEGIFNLVKRLKEKKLKIICDNMSKIHYRYYYDDDEEDYTSLCNVFNYIQFYHKN